MVQPYDDSQFKADVARLRAYLAWCREQLAHNRPSPPKARRAKAIDRELSKHKPTHIYMLEGPRPERWQPSATRKHAAPVWTTINAA